MKIQKLQVARRTLQLLALVLALLIPAVARYNNYLAARELDKTLERWDGTLQGEALGWIDNAMRQLPGAEKERTGSIARDRKRLMEYAHALHGGPWSIEMGPLSMTDPLGAAESIAASKSTSRVLWIGLLVPLVVAVLLGRVFCSWICPMGFFLELTDKLRRPLRWLELRPFDVQVSRTTKYVLLVVGLLLAAAMAAPILGFIYPPAIIGREFHDLVFGIFDRAETGRFGFWAGGLTWMSLILLVIALVEISVSKRWWCRYVCPGGALYALLGWLRPLRVKLDPAKCTSCGLCNKACHLGLKPMQNEMGIECDNCGLCISNCGDDALDYTIQVRAPRSEAKRVVSRAAVLLLLLLTAFVRDAGAHHILGIPHYAYDERYPQVPILTYKVMAGALEVEMTGYPGMPKPGEQCFLNVYIRDPESGATFDGAVSLEVLRDRLIGSDPVVYGPVTAALEEAVYKFYPRFESESNYTVRIRWEADGAPWILDLPMVVGEPGSPWAVLGGVGGGLLLFLIGIRAARIKMRRRALGAARAGARSHHPAGGIAT
jgi:ferredoxin-type protein NapH